MRVDSDDTLAAYYEQAIAAAGFAPQGGPADFPESSQSFKYHPAAPGSDGGASISGSQVTMAFTGIPPANYGD